MSKKKEFDSWFDCLTSKEQSEVIDHILATRLTPCNEGIHSGPSGQRIEKGLFSGPSGYSNSRACPSCGRPM